MTIKLKIFVILLFFSQTSLAQGQVLRFATEATYPPFAYMDSNKEIQGFDIEIVKALCKKMQANCEFEHHPWDVLIINLEQNKFDGIIGGLSVTEARKRRVNFTDAFYKSQGKLIARTDDNIELNEENISDYIVGTQSGTTFRAIFREYVRKVFGQKANIRNYASIENAFSDLEAGRLHLVFGDGATIDNWLASQSSNDYQTLAFDLPEQMNEDNEIAIAVNKNNDSLLAQLNKVLAEFKGSEEYQKIYNKYFY